MSNDRNTKPAIVIVPGSGHSPIHYQPLSQQLTQKGFDVTCIANLTVGGGVEIRLQDDVNGIIRTINNLLGNNDSVRILITTLESSIPQSGIHAWRAHHWFPFPNDKSSKMKAHVLCSFV